MASQSEIEFWLKTALARENLTTYAVTIEGNTETGAGYLGDVLFVQLTGKTKNSIEKRYDLVLKVSHRSEALRKTNPISLVFENEITIYEQVFSAFTDFQRSRGFSEVFDSVPKYYGNFKSESVEVVVLENLKKLGYLVRDRTQPMTRDHINLVVEEYGKFHAISVAMAAQQPEKFAKVAGSLKNLWELFRQNESFEEMFTSNIDEVYELLKDDLDASGMEDWKKLNSQIMYIYSDMVKEASVKVITHGDCWNNNFMFQPECGIPSKVVILDWQISKVASPVLDLSYFLFSNISEVDIEDVDCILRDYYASFSNFLKRLGSDPQKLYSFAQLLEDWKLFAKYGMVSGSLMVKVCLLKKEDTPDIAKAAESGGGLTDAFVVKVTDNTKFKERVRYIVKYAIEHGILTKNSSTS